jgi:sodium/bile acid cotransporter 7
LNVSLIRQIKTNWFMLGLVAITVVTVADVSQGLVTSGLWLKKHSGPDVVIVLIFFFSGLALNTRQIHEGVTDYRGTLLALSLIFLAAPLVVAIFLLPPLPTGIRIGIFLVAAMPTTLSSGVVMTGSAGGNMAHALLITIIANALAVVTIPVTLGILLGFTGAERVIEIDQVPMMVKIATLVLLPLVVGIIVRSQFGEALGGFLPCTSTVNQLAILTIVWMALCAGRDAILAGLGSILPVLCVVFTFHLLMAICGILAARLAGLEKTRRESVILMGGQKTLPLSIILQVSLFPEFGLALVVCVTHHIVHLIMDAFLLRYLKKKA